MAKSSSTTSEPRITFSGTVASNELATPVTTSIRLASSPCSGEVMLTWESTSSCGSLASGSAVGTPSTVSTGLPSSRNCTGARAPTTPCSV